MAWSKPTRGRANQIGLVQIYRKAAGLDRPAYIQLLHTHTGAFTSTDPSLTQWHFDTFMPILEMLVEQHHRDTGAPLPKRITQLRYWRERMPKNGEMNSRQRHRIISPDGKGLWDLLQEHLPPEHRHMGYLVGMAKVACGYHVRDFWALKAWQANLLIEALKDRLHHALKKAG